MDIIKSPETHEKNAVIKGTLYLVGTPIGNLSDLSERAKKVLSEVDFIAAEDTRVSGAMLSKFGIKKPLCSYYEHNKKGIIFRNALFIRNVILRHFIENEGQIPTFIQEK